MFPSIGLPVLCRLGSVSSASGSGAGGQGQERLADFIRHNQTASSRNGRTSRVSARPPATACRDLLSIMLPTFSMFVADDLEVATDRPRAGREVAWIMAAENGPFHQSAAEIHAALRLADGLDIYKMVSECRALRVSVVKQGAAQHETPARTDIQDLTQFNEAIDQAVTESVAHYTKTINNSRNCFSAFSATVCAIR